MNKTNPNITRVAVVGTGSAGMKHLNALATLSQVEAIAIPKRRHRITELQRNGFKSTSSLEKALELGITKCIVASDTAHHLLDCKEAINHGLDVMVEKPIASSSKESLELTRLSYISSKQLYVACVLRFSKSLLQFRELLSEIGDLHSVLIECRSHLPDWRPNRNYKDSYSAQPAQGGVLLDLVHEIDYATWIFGWPTSLYARVKNLGRLEIPTDEVAELSWESEERYTVSINLDYITQEPIRRIRALGSSGRLDWNGISGHVKLATNHAIKEFFSDQSISDMFKEQAKSFVSSDAHGAIDNLVSGESGTKVLNICESARTSSKSNKLELVNYP